MKPYILLFLLAGATLPVVAQSQLVLADPPYLNVDANGAATAAISLRNRGASPAAFSLILSDFEHKTASGKPYVLGTSYTLTPLTDADKADFTKGEINKTLHLKLTVSKLWEAGESTAVLKNGDEDIPTESGAPRALFRALRIPQAYNVDIDPAGGTPGEVVLSGGGRTLIRLVNSDAADYRFCWQLRVGGAVRPSPSPCLDVPAAGSAYLDLTLAAPPVSLFEGGTIRDQLERGELILQPVFESDVGIPPIAPKVLPLTLRLQYWSGWLQNASSLFWVFFLLTLGGMTSIWVHCGMPNTARALTMSRAKKELDAKLDGIGPDVASRWRVLLAARLDGIDAALRSTWWVFPSFAATLDSLDKELAIVKDWIDVTYGVSMLLRETQEKVQNGLPPTIVRWIHEKSDCALAQFASGFTTAEEMQHMWSDLKTAQTYLALGSGGGALPELEKAIQDREAGLAAAMTAVEAVFPGQFTALISQVEGQSGKPLSPANYLDRDTFSLKVDLLGQVSELMARTGGAAAAAAAAGGARSVLVDGLATRLDKYRDRLIAYIQPDSPESLRLARLFVNEMRQDIYEQALLLEVNADPPRLTIIRDYEDCDCGTPLHFMLRFSRQLLNEAAVCHEWTCDWDFGDGSLHECGWDVYHTYRRTGKFTISVRITELDGESILLQPLTSQVDIGALGRTDSWYRWLWNRAKPHAETMLEASRLALVLVLAVFGLVGPAARQAQALTLIQAAGAVFTLGFGADTLKNLITQRGGS